MASADLQSTGPDVITFAYIKGMWYSFPSAHRARMAVQKYTGNSDTITSTKPSGVAINTTLGWKPDGALVDTTTWPNQVFAPEGVTGDDLWNPPANPITTNVEEEEEGGEVVVEEEEEEGEEVEVEEGEEVEIEEEEVDELDWSGLDQDLLNLAKRYASAGMFGKAKATFTQAGGTWDAAVHNALKTGSETKGYGGTIDFNWASLGVDKDMLQTIKDLAKQGKYGQVAKLMGDNWSKDVHDKLKAFEHMGSKDYVNPNAKKGDDKDNGGGSKKTTRSSIEGVGVGGAYDITTGKGSKEDITGAYKTGEKRLDAKEWRARQMDAAKKLYGDDPSKMSKTDKAAWIKKRNAIALRHKKMIGK